MRIIQVIDVDSEGFKIRLADGSVVNAPHGGLHPQLGDDFTGETKTVEVETESPVGETQPE